jgi:hypothetical protein
MNNSTGGKGMRVRNLLVVAAATLGLAQTAQAHTCTTVRCLAKQVAHLQHEVSHLKTGEAEMRERFYPIDATFACLAEVPVNEAANTSLQVTPIGSAGRAWLLFDQCNLGATAVPHADAPATDPYLGPISLEWADVFAQN